MASPEVLEFSKLLAPIAGDNPAGMDLRADDARESDFRTIKAAREVARDAERQSLDYDPNANPPQTPPPPPNWRPVIEKGTRILAARSKDLEVTAYLIEGLVREHGIAGLRDGFRLARELIAQYWDGIYPMSDGEEGHESRINRLVGLNGRGSEGTLIMPIVQVPLTDRTSVGVFSLTHYQEAYSLSQLDPKARDKKIAQGAVSLEKLKEAVNETPAQFYKDLLDDLTQGMKEFAEFCEVLKVKCGGQPPPSTNIRTALDSCLKAVKDVAGAKIPPNKPPEKKDGEKPPEKKEGQPPPPPERPEGPIQTREDALKTLLKVADFFRRTEPHSVLSYTLEQVVNWGRMSLPELLSELIPEDGPRKTLFKQVGIRPPDPPKK